MSLFEVIEKFIIISTIGSENYIELANSCWEKLAECDEKMAIDFWNVYKKVIIKN